MANFASVLFHGLFLMALFSSSFCVSKLISKANGESKPAVPQKIARLIEFSFPTSSDRMPDGKSELDIVEFQVSENGPDSKQFRREFRDSNGVLKGFYGLDSSLGFYKEVEYTADDGGYRALVKSKQPNLVLWNDMRGVHTVPLTSNTRDIIN